MAAKAVQTKTARDLGYGHLFPTYKEIGEEFDINPQLVSGTATKILNGGDILRKKGTGRVSALDEMSKKRLDRFLISINGDASYEQESYGASSYKFLNLLRICKVEDLKKWKCYTIWFVLSKV